MPPPCSHRHCFHTCPPSPLASALSPASSSPRPPPPALASPCPLTAAGGLPCGHTCNSQGHNVGYALCQRPAGVSVQATEIATHICHGLLCIAGAQIPQWVGHSTLTLRHSFGVPRNDATAPVHAVTPVATHQTAPSLPWPPPARPPPPPPRCQPPPPPPGARY